MQARILLQDAQRYTSRIKRNIKAGVAADDNEAFLSGEFSRQKEEEAINRALESVVLELDEDEIDMDEVQDSDDNPKLDMVVPLPPRLTPSSRTSLRMVMNMRRIACVVVYARL